jgi:tetratricopeptide (TPR) repeat protein
MVCPRCRTPNPEGTNICLTCSTPIDLNDVTLPAVNNPTGPADPGMTVAMENQGTWAQPTNTLENFSQITLQPGSMLAHRYQIVKMLGEGGMGAVYRAHDIELDREVAIKVIRPELARNAQVLQRFKQELILARQVTHRNIIRIFDLGQSEGMRFITMEFIQGEDVSQILAGRTKLPAPEAASIIAQVARGLEVAHAEGVVHRDLKPQNIMLDAQGKASVMDFGIARSMDASNMTRTGALLGTPTYMSPEQAQGVKVDARSDLYTLGIIFYELLCGKPPFEADNPMATLVKRIQEKPTPLIEVEPTVPKSLNYVVMKMLATKPEDRYQNAAEVLAALDTYEMQRTGRTVLATTSAAAQSGIPIKYVIAAMAFLFALGGYLYTHKLSAPPAQTAARKSVKVLVSDFQNTTGDSVFDGTLEPTFSLAMEGAGFISSFSRGDARKAAAKLQPGATRLDEQLAERVAQSEGIDVVVAGSILKSGSGYEIRAKAVDGFKGTVIIEKTASASNKQDVLLAAGKLAAPIRTKLGDTTPEATQLRAAETFSSGSMEAAQAYAKAQELYWEAKPAEAIPFYEQAIKADPEMGRAYAGLALAYRRRDPKEAEKYFQLAMSKTARMTPREQYRTRGAYYLFTRNDSKALEEFTQLTTQFPADDAGQLNLATAYSYVHDFKRAIDAGRRLADSNKRNVLYRSNVACYAMYAGQFEDAIREADEALKLNANAATAQKVRALSLFALGRSAEAADALHKLATSGVDGAAAAAIGLADMTLYAGSNAEAVKILEAGNPTDAHRLALLATARRRGPAATAAALKAIEAAGGSAGPSFLAAKVLLENGSEAKALEVAKMLGARIEAPVRAYGKLLEGEALLAKGKAQAALDMFQEAKKLDDTWMGHFDLGRAYLEAGAFTEASSEFDECEKRKGEVTALFFEETPTLRYFPPVYYYQGRVRDGMKRTDAGDAYKSFVAIKSKADAGDSLVSDAQKRAK